MMRAALMRFLKAGTGTSSLRYACASPRFPGSLVKNPRENIEAVFETWLEV